MAVLYRFRLKQPFNKVYGSTFKALNQPRMRPLFTTCIKLLLALSICYRPISAHAFPQQVGVDSITQALSRSIQLGKSYRADSEFDSALAVFSRSIDLTAQHGSQEQVPELHFQSGITHWYAEDLTKAKQSFLRVLSLDSTSVFAADSWHNIGLLEEHANEPYKAIQAIERSIDIYALLNLGHLLKDQGDLAGALHSFHTCVSIAEQLDESVLQAKAFHGVGYVHEHQRNFSRAATAYRSALSIFITQRKELFQANMWNNLGNVYRAQYRTDSAIYFYEKALEIKQKQGTPKEVSSTLNNLAGTFIMQGKWHRSIAASKDALRIKRQFTDSVSVAYTFNELARAYSELGQFTTSRNYLDSVHIYNTAENLDVELRSIENEADLLFKQGEHERAAERLKDYSALYKRRYDLRTAHTISSLQERFDAKGRAELIDSLEVRGSELYDTTAKQSRIIGEQDRKITVRNYLILSAILLLIALILLGRMLFQRYKIKQLKTAMETEEALKKDIGRDLHDVVGSNLNGLRIMANSVNSDGSPEGVLAKISDNLQTVAQDVRSLAYRLVSTELRDTDLSFTEVLDRHLKEFQYHHRIRVVLDSEIPSSFDELTQVAQSHLLAIIKEALNNVQRHANADRVEFFFTQGQENIEIKIVDNGDGLQEEKLEGLGIRNMQERASQLGGQLHVRSNEMGTTLTLTMKKV